MNETTLRFQDRNQDLASLSHEIAKDLMADGYSVQSSGSEDTVIMQARKEGLMRDIFAADRAFTIMITGTPNDFSIRIGVGKLVQDLAVTAVEALVLSDLFLVVDVPEIMWTEHVKNGLVKHISRIANAHHAGHARARK